MSDPLSAAIDAAVARAIEAQLPTIVQAVKQAVVQPPTEQDRFLPIKDAAAQLGKSPSTIWRLERDGKMPPRERLGGTVGYRQSTVNKILKSAANADPIPAPKGAIKPGERRRQRAAA